MLLVTTPLVVMTDMYDLSNHLLWTFSPAMPCLHVYKLEIKLTNHLLIRFVLVKFKIIIFPTKVFVTVFI